MEPPSSSRSSARASQSRAKKMVDFDEPEEAASPRVSSTAAQAVANASTRTANKFSTSARIQEIRSEAVKPTLGSFGRHVGPGADIKELEYVSCLHQNAERLLRKDGTIAASDIGPYLTSRYGLKIRSAQARDIALNLCGAKPRNAFSAEMDKMHAERNELDGHTKGGHGGEGLLEDMVPDVPISPKASSADDSEQTEETYEEEIYFDMVQLMSLLMIPELVAITEPDNVRRISGIDEKKAKASMPEPVLDRIAIKVVMESILEVFDEKLQKKIRQGDVPLNHKMMRLMLTSFGDSDAAMNKELIQSMLDGLAGPNGEPPMFTLDNFVRVLTEDVQTYQRTVLDAASKSIKSGEEEGYASVPSKNTEGTIDVIEKQTSVFFDVFGDNWDEHPKPTLTTEASKMEGSKKETKKGVQTYPRLNRTAIFIDYCAETYRSQLHNTTVWVLFILSTLIYLNFFLEMFKAETGGFPCDSDSVGCTIGKKIIIWILTAFFCGIYGMAVLLPTSIGNVYSQKGLLFFTLAITATLTYAPFSTLMWYRKGVPHVSYEIHEYELVCPGWYNKTIADSIELDEEVDWTRVYLTLDSQCSPAVEWCEKHPEVQGRYIDTTKDHLTYDEFERCADFVLNFGAFELFPFWNFTGDPCNDAGDCPIGVACAKSDLYSLDEPSICCNTGKSVFVTDFLTGFSNETNTAFVCDGQPIGAPCKNDRMCLSDKCVLGYCGVNPAELEANEVPLELGSPCNRSNEVCRSGMCFEGTCQEQPMICPVRGTELLGGFRIDPFCRTFGDWCEANDYVTLALAFLDLDEEELQEMSLETGDLCLDVLLKFIEADQTYGWGMLQIINETAADIGYTYEIEDTNAIEEVLLDEWSKLVLLCIAVVGGLAVLAILKGLLTQKDPDERPRDFKIKCAAAHKMENVIGNALSMHQLEGKRRKGQTMRNFFLLGEQVVETGGLFWTWKRIMNGSLLSKEGVRVSGRIFIAQLVQIIVFVLGFIYAVNLIVQLGDEIDELRKELNDHYTVDQLKDISTKEWLTISEEDLEVTSWEEDLLETIPERWMVDVAGYSALVVATFVAIFIMLVYIPSFTNTVLKLRCGMKGSLHDPYFDEYRNSGDNVIQNISNMIFAFVGAAAFCYILFAAIVFLCVWNKSREIVAGYVAIAIGITCTIILKVVVMKILRVKNFSAFYRKKAWDANFVNLFFECYYIGTGALVVATRIGIFLGMSVLWLGRVDVEFMDEDVKIAGKGLDKLPTSFKRDLFGHEAHFHPYIERLGQMYLLRLRDGKEFGNVASTTWRCLFVAGLMPWIVKYKVNTFNAILDGPVGMPDYSMSEVGDFSEFDYEAEEIGREEGTSGKSNEVSKRALSDGAVKYGVAVARMPNQMTQSVTGEVYA